MIAFLFIALTSGKYIEQTLDVHYFVQAKCNELTKFHFTGSGYMIIEYQWSNINSTNVTLHTHSIQQKDYCQSKDPGQLLQLTNQSQSKNISVEQDKNVHIVLCTCDYGMNQYMFTRETITIKINIYDSDHSHLDSNQKHSHFYMFASLFVNSIFILLFLRAQLSEGYTFINQLILLALSVSIISQILSLIDHLFIHQFGIGLPGVAIVASLFHSAQYIAISYTYILLQTGWGMRYRDKLYYLQIFVILFLMYLFDFLLKEILVDTNYEYLSNYVCALFKAATWVEFYMTKEPIADYYPKFKKSYYLPANIYFLTQILVKLFLHDRKQQYLCNQYIKSGLMMISRFCLYLLRRSIKYHNDQLELKNH